MVTRQEIEPTGPMPCLTRWMIDVKKLQARVLGVLIEASNEAGRLGRERLTPRRAREAPRPDS